MAELLPWSGHPDDVPPRRWVDDSLMRTERNTTDRAIGRGFGVGMLLLGAGLALNTLLGPLVADLVDYPFTETVRNETLGLEAISLLLVSPLAMVAGLLALRDHPASAVVALGPAAYSAYMFVQYVVGPQYPTYEAALLLHLGLFILSGSLLIRAWSLLDVERLPDPSRGWVVIVIVLAAFVFSRWSGALAGFPAADTVPAAAPDLTMYWSIFLLDLGFVVPVTISTAIGLLLRRPWATKLLYGIVGWFALVPPSVATMSLVKVLRDDPAANGGDAIVLGVVSLIMAAVTLWLYRPLFGRTDRRVFAGTAQALAGRDG